MTRCCQNVNDMPWILDLQTVMRTSVAELPVGNPQVVLHQVAITNSS